MALDTMLTVSPAGIASVCGEWFDEECPPEVAIQVATDQGRKRPSNGSSKSSDLTIIWIKSRLREHNLFRGMAVELGVKDGTPSILLPAGNGDGGTEDLAAAVETWNRWNSGYARSRISRSPLMIRPIDRVADQVAHFEDHRGCPYCRKWYRNGAALRLHVIDAHLSS